MSVARTASVISAERRAGVQRRHDAERRRAGDLVAGPQRVLHRGRAPPGRQQREVQVHPAVRRDVERALRQQRAVGDDRAAVRCQRAQLGLEVRVAGVLRLEHRVRRAARRAAATGEATSRRPRPAGASGRVTTPTSSWRLAATASSDGQGGLRGAGEDHPHQQAEPAGCGCGESRGVGRGGRCSAPNHADSRIAFIAALRVSRSSRSMNRIPSRWSVSCWMRAGEQLAALDGDRLAVHVEALGDHAQGPGAVEGQVGQGQAALGAELLLLGEVERPG